MWTLAALEPIGVAALLTAVFGAITGSIATYQSWKAKREESESKREARNATDAATGMGVGLEYMREALGLYRLQQAEDRDRMAEDRKRIATLEGKVAKQEREISDCHSERDQLRRELAAIYNRGSS